MNRIEKIKFIRNILASGKPSVGSWMQIADASIAEIMGQNGYDWVAVDLEHGSVSVHQLPSLFRALELGDTLPIARIAEGNGKDCQQALDAGAGGIIVPMIETAEQLVKVRDACYWPPSGIRGVAFSRANLYGKNFDSYQDESQSPLLIAIIESIKATNNLNEILQVKGLDSILIGPYDLSASMGITGMFNNSKFINVISQIKSACDKYQIPCGIHVVMPDQDELKHRIDEGYTFIPYSIDSVFLSVKGKKPK